MRVLITSFSLPSHRRCLIPLARALERAGHQVAAVDVDVCAGPLTSEAFVGPLACQNAEKLRAMADRFAPDLIVREDTEFAGYLVAETRGIPHVCVSCGAANTIRPEWLLARLNACRERLGLDPDPDYASIFRHGYLDVVPPEFSFAAYDIPATRAYRFPLPDDDGERMPDWFAGVPADRPLVVAAMGTAAQPGAAEFLRRTVEALGAMRCVAVVAGGASVEAPSHVHLVDRVPQPLLLPSADLFITHGGINSIREAIGCGVPLVVTPFAADQPHNAERVTELGLGVALDPAEATAHGIRQACERVLGDPGFTRRARTARRHLLTLPDLTVAVADLEALTRAPGTGRGTAR